MEGVFCTIRMFLSWNLELLVFLPWNLPLWAFPSFTQRFIPFAFEFTPVRSPLFQVVVQQPNGMLVGTVTETCWICTPSFEVS